MPKGFRNTNLNQRMPGRRIPVGPPPPKIGPTGFRPSREKHRPPKWGPPKPPEPPKAEEPVQDAKEKPAEPEKKP
jgi:hypothetical protein